MTAAAISRLNADHRRALNAYARKHGRTWRKSLLAARARGGYGIEGDLAHAVNLIGPSGLRAYKVGATPNPSARCAPVRLASGKRFNAFDGRTVKYKGNTYEVVGCGTGSVASKRAGALSEGTYALRNLKTGKIRYVAKRTVRDLAYHRGGRAILGMPKKPRAKARKAPARKPAKRRSTRKGR